MKNLTIFLLFLCTIILTACKGIFVVGKTSDYNRVFNIYKSNITEYNGNISNIKADDSLYVIKASQVKDFIKTQKKVMIYNFMPFTIILGCIATHTSL